MSRAAARRAGRRRARRAADARGRAAGRRRISPHRGARPGPRRPSLDVPINAVGADRHLARARLHRSEAAGGRRDDASWSRTTCPTGWSSISPRRRARSPATRRPRSRSTAAILYGAPAAELDLEGEVVIARGQGARRVSPATSSASPTRRSRPAAQPLEDLPETDDKGKASFDVTLDKLPATSRPLEAQVIVRMAEAGGRAVERKITLPVAPTGEHDRRQAAVLRPLARRGRERDLRRRAGRARRQDAGRATGLRYELLKIESRYQWYRRDGRWDYEPVKTTRRVADGTDRCRRRQARRASRCRCSGAAIGSKSRPATPTGRSTSVGFDAGWYTEASADTPDMLEIALDKPEYRPGDTMTVAVTARTAGRVTLNVIGDQLLSSITQDVQPGAAQHQDSGRHATGAAAPMWWRRCAVRSTPRRSACPAAPSACSGSRSTARRTRSRSI